MSPKEQDHVTITISGTEQGLAAVVALLGSLEMNQDGQLVLEAAPDEVAKILGLLDVFKSPHVVVNHEALASTLYYLAPEDRRAIAFPELKIWRETDQGKTAGYYNILVRIVKDWHKIQTGKEYYDKLTEIPLELINLLFETSSVSEFDQKFLEIMESNGYTQYDLFRYAKPNRGLGEKTYIGLKEVLYGLLTSQE